MIYNKHVLINTQLILRTKLNTELKLGKQIIRKSVFRHLGRLASPIKTSI